MKNAMTLYISRCLIALCILGCKEIPVTITDPVIPETKRMVLLEELTGASCPNCPKGSAAIENILTKYPGKVAVVGIHGDFLSQPTVKSKYDFRNQKAKDLENWFKPWFGKPAASINRVPDETDALMIDLPDLWQSVVEKELLKPQIMNILLESAYDDLTRKVEVKIAAIPLDNISGNFNISIYLTESNITDAQSNGSVIEENFHYKDVLRDMMTNFVGDALADNLQKNTIINRTYSYTLPKTSDGLWIPENMEIVVMVSHNEPKNKQVLQAAVIKVKE